MCGCCAKVDEPGMRYNIPLINALVLYVGTQAIAYINSKGLTPSMSTIAHSSHMDIFQNMGVSLDTEGEYPAKLALGKGGNSSGFLSYFDQFALYFCTCISPLHYM